MKSFPGDLEREWSGEVCRELLALFLSSGRGAPVKMADRRRDMLARASEGS